jgi:hypothetical protein
MTLLRNLIREALLLEDKRGSIRRLGIPKEMAELFHNFYPPLSYKFSYWIAEQFLHYAAPSWAVEKNRLNFDKFTKTLRRRKEEDLKRRSKRDKDLYWFDPKVFEELMSRKANAKSYGVVVYPYQHASVLRGLGGNSSEYQLPNPGDYVTSTKGPFQTMPEYGVFIGYSTGGTVRVLWGGTNDITDANIKELTDRLDDQWKRNALKSLMKSWEDTFEDGSLTTIFKWLEERGGGLDPSKMTLEQALEKAKAHNAVKDSEAKGEIIKKFKDGYYWINLNTRKCDYEAKQMGHCGTASTDGSLLSLRDKFGKPHVTTTLTPEGKIIEMKGKENNKPAKKYHKYIVQLLAMPIIEDLVVRGNHGDDFEITDLDEKPMAWLLSQRPEWNHLSYTEMSAMNEYIAGNQEWSTLKKVLDGKKSNASYPDKYREDGISWYVESMLNLASLEEYEAAYNIFRAGFGGGSLSQVMPYVGNALKVTDSLEEIGNKIERWKDRITSSSTSLPHIETFKRKIQRYTKEYERQVKVRAMFDDLTTEISRRVFEQLTGLDFVDMEWVSRLGESGRAIRGKIPYRYFKKLLEKAGLENEKDIPNFETVLKRLDVINEDAVFEFLDELLDEDSIREMVEKTFEDEEESYWFIDDLDVEWPGPGHTVSLDATVEHSFTGRIKQASEHLGMPSDAELQDLDWEELAGQDQRQQSVDFDGTDENGNSWNLQIELDPTTGEWEFYDDDWVCTDCE